MVGRFVTQCITCLFPPEKKSAVYQINCADSEKILQKTYTKMVKLPRAMSL